jgi:bacterioferritin-associated ferredoxin
MRKKGQENGPINQLEIREAISEKFKYQAVEARSGLQQLNNCGKCQKVSFSVING